ncbi:hypothetical protein LAZ67_X003635 [Cordylochernes scorpioides]|uniref:Mos1 transposase HTH domain-containing protein n=1 Tax=Cordylochernes scorpioides TaxID=51811 RepID=A0ABY6LYE3_9ARAC|nr:hypothetical protein LAZ67_X003635 [Cordylochernes scorpioides]
MVCGRDGGPAMKETHDIVRMTCSSDRTLLAVSTAHCHLGSEELYDTQSQPPGAQMLVEVYGEKCMDIKNVRKWCREFNEGRINVHDEQRSGRLSLPESTVARIDEMVRANRRITLEEIEDGLNEDCSHFSVHKIVSETLGYRKVSARWVDKWLKEAAGEWYNTGITKLVDRMEKVIEHQGDYRVNSTVLVKDTFTHLRIFMPRRKEQSSFDQVSEFDRGRIVAYLRLWIIIFLENR